MELKNLEGAGMGETRGIVIIGAGQEAAQAVMSLRRKVMRGRSG